METLDDQDEQIYLHPPFIDQGVFVLVDQERSPFPVYLYCEEHHRKLGRDCHNNFLIFIFIFILFISLVSFKNTTAAVPHTQAEALVHVNLLELLSHIFSASPFLRLACKAD